MAQSAQQGIVNQRGTIQSSLRRLQATVDSIPLIGQIMGKIRMKWSKDSIILGLLIGCLSLLLLWAIFHR